MAKSSVTNRQMHTNGDAFPVSNGYEPTVTNQGEYGDDFNGDWPSDGFILPGTATIDQKPGRGQFVQGSNGRGSV